MAPLGLERDPCSLTPHQTAGTGTQCPQPQRYKEQPALGAKSTEREKTESSFERFRGQSQFVRLGMVASNVVVKAASARAERIVP